MFPLSENRAGARAAEHFQVILDSVQDAILVLDCAEGRFLDANRRSSELLGYGREELAGMDLAQISFGLSPFSGVEAEVLVREAAQGEAIIREWLVRDRHGRLFWVEMNLLRTDIAGVERILLTARDISERKRTESEHSARLKRAESLNAVSLALAGAGPDYESALALMAHYLAVQLGDLCLLQILDGNGFLTPLALSQSYLDGDRLLPAMGSLPSQAPEQTSLAEVVHPGRPLSLHDPEGREPREAVGEPFHPYFDHYRIHSLLAVPMRFQDQVIGTILLAKGGPQRAYTLEDQAMLQSLADRTALTITNGRLYRENLRQAEELRRVNADLERRVAERTAELAEANEQLRLLATTDGLTGLANRRHFDAVLAAELRRACREERGLSLILCDVDFFKRYNDHYGHVAGDTCLQAVGQILRTIFRRASELPARYGGEEFAVILPGAGPDHALRAAEKLRAAVEAKGIPHANSEVSGVVTLSVGVMSCMPDPATQTSDLLAQADAALYACKQGGRNRVGDLPAC
nr:diguanylate cyclase [uncultured Holophaga sp.]